MSSKRDSYIQHMQAVYSILIPEIGIAIDTYFDELEQCLKESAELKAETIELAEQRAWDAAREGLNLEVYVDYRRRDPDSYTLEGYAKYKSFDDWKRRETARELTQEAEELGMYEDEGK